MVSAKIHRGRHDPRYVSMEGAKWQGVIKPITAKPSDQVATQQSAMCLAIMIPIAFILGRSIGLPAYILRERALESAQETSRAGGAQPLCVAMVMAMGEAEAGAEAGAPSGAAP